MPHNPDDRDNQPIDREPDDLIGREDQELDEDLDDLTVDDDDDEEDSEAS
jgi:hypothetical protein